MESMTPEEFMDLPGDVLGRIELTGDLETLEVSGCRLTMAKTVTTKDFAEMLRYIADQFEHGEARRIE